MTTKRFIETISTGIVTDTLTGKEYNCDMRIDDELLKQLNYFCEENERLKQWNQCLAEKRHKELQELQNDDTIADLESQIAKLKKEKKELQEALIRCSFD